LIYKNEVFGRFDGNVVKELDPHERSIFYTPITYQVKPKVEYIKPKAECIKPKTKHTDVSVCEAKTADDILAEVYVWQID
jgi:hypothetical protein